MRKIKLTISDWFNGIWGNRVLFFKNLQEAKKESKKHGGRVKIYNDKNQVIVSEENNDKESYA